MFYIKEFLNHLKERRYSTKTVKDYSYLIHHFERYCKDRGLLDVKNISETEVLEYLRLIKKRKQSGKVYAVKISRLTRYFQFLEDEGILFLSPLREYAPSKYPHTHYPHLNQTEIESILKAIRTDHPLCLKAKAIIELAYSSALRPREMYNLKITDIDFSKGFIFIEQSKNQKDRIVPVGRTALLWVEKYIKEVRTKFIKDKKHNYVFISHKTGEKLTVWGIRWAIQEALRLSNRKPIKPYSLRSTAATALLLNGMNIAYISKLLGHSDIRNTQIYLRVKTMELKRELAYKHPRMTLEESYKHKKEE